MNTEENTYKDNDGVDEFNVDWMGLFFKLIDNWKFIAIFTFIFACVGVVKALCTHHTWKVDVTLAPESTGGRSASSALSSLNGLLGGMQMATSSGSDAINYALFPQICKSTQFLAGLFDVPVQKYVRPEARKKGKEAQTVTFYDFLTKKGEKNWFSSIFMGSQEDDQDQELDMKELSYKQNLMYLYLTRHISANYDMATGITTLSVRLNDQAVATQIADTICKRLQQYVVDYRTGKARDDYEYYTRMADEAYINMTEKQEAYARSVDGNRNVILQSVNSERQRLQDEATLASQIYMQFAQQKESAKLKIQEDKPVFAVIQTATTPLNPAESRASIVIMFTGIGLILAMAWKLWFQSIYENVKTSVKKRRSEQASNTVS